MPETNHEPLRHALFRKSSFSDPNKECVEIAHIADGFGVRDSKLVDSPIVAVSGQHGRGFIQAVRSGMFDQ